MENELANINFLNFLKVMQPGVQILWQNWQLFFYRVVLYEERTQTGDP